MYSGLKYQNFDGNKYLDGDPFMASAIFAQNDDDLKDVYKRQHLLGRQPAEGDDVELPPECLVHRAQLRLLQRSALHVDLLDRRLQMCIRDRSASRAAWKKASPGRNMMTNSGHGENWAK